jgi:hypothetical protein
MRVGKLKTVWVEAKTLRIHTKVTDRFCASIVDQDGETIWDQEDGYVPDIMPGDHYGDYIILDIDLETGQILNWKKPSENTMQELINRGDE